MENLIQFTETVLKIAEESCTPCLIEHLGHENAALDRTIGRLQVAYEWLGDPPESQQEFADAFAGFLTLVVKMTIFTGVLMRRPGVRWTDENTEIVWPVIHLSAN